MKDLAFDTNSLELQPIDSQKRNSRNLNKVCNQEIQCTDQDIRLYNQIGENKNLTISKNANLGSSQSKLLSISVSVSSSIR